MASDSVSINKGVKVGKNVAAPGDDTPAWRRWWALDPAKNDGLEMAQAIQETVKAMRLNQGGRIDQATLSARLYGNAPIGLLMGGGQRNQASIAALSASRDVVKQNVIQAIIDTSTATIGENKPRPYYLTDGGDYRLQRQAKKLNQFSDGMFYEQNAYDLGSNAQRDGEIFGDGWLYVGQEHGRVTYRPVLGVELWCDELEGTMTLPRQLHWERPWDREVAIALWPKKEKFLRAADRADPRDYGMPPTSTSDMVVIRWSWHLRSGPEATDGVCVASIENAVLTEPADKTWSEDFYPFARWSWTPIPASFWSQGLAAQLQSQQIQYNKMSAVGDAAMHRAGTAKVFLEKGSKVVKEHLNNEVGAIVEYIGTKPIYEAPRAVDADHWARMEMLEEGMWNKAGLSRMVGEGEKPRGLDSGAALRTYRDSTSQRMKTQERLNERGYLDLARISIAVARQIALKTGKPYEVRSGNQRSLRKVSMSAEELNPSDWRLQCFPTSSLPKDPAGRYATIQEWIQAGFLTMRQGKKLMDFPDLQAHEALDTAEEDLLTKTLDDIVDDGLYAPPEPTDNLALAKELVLEYINYGRLHGLEPEHLELLHVWNAQVDALMQMAMPPPMPGGAPGMPPGGAGGPPQAAPIAPPPSNLLPFAA
jgi:hypothetical protein